MRSTVSILTCCIISVVLLQYRINYSDMSSHQHPLKVTIWDAFGYYIYLPAICIYKDVKHLNWLTEIDKKYAVTGGNGWQAEKLNNGNYVFKYLGGVAILEIPWFALGHFIAKHSKYPADGFSPPYQYALGFGVIFYCILSIFLLRKILRVYFSDTAVAITLVLICLATNFIQYASIDNGQSHGYIFPLYVLVLYTTIKWHQQPKLVWAILTGYVIGLATISRPTEAIMLFIPLMWHTQNKIATGEKWQLVKQHKSHIVFAGIAGITGILPQLIYWKITSGSFLYDVGSKWEFLDPHFRVLFGWEKGWFIYTPITLFFIIGMFFIKQLPFRKSVLWFCLLNIYIIIAWDDWRYGGSYSTRALVQCYPVFALPLAAFVEKIQFKKWRFVIYFLFAYLLFVNLFQIYQYNKAILHYDDMNRRYYSSIYLNPHPLSVDMSLLDSNELLTNETGYHQQILVQTDTNILLHFTNKSLPLANLQLASTSSDTWLKVTAVIKAPNYLWQSYLHAELRVAHSVKHARVRLFSPISENDSFNTYAFYISVPVHFNNSILNVYITTRGNFEGVVQRLIITKFEQ